MEGGSYGGQRPAIMLHRLPAQDLRRATDKPPVGKFIKGMEELLLYIKLPFQAGALAQFGETPGGRFATLTKCLKQATRRRRRGEVRA